MPTKSDDLSPIKGRGERDTSLPLFPISIAFPEDRPLKNGFRFRTVGETESGISPGTGHLNHGLNSIISQHTQVAARLSAFTSCFPSSRERAPFLSRPAKSCTSPLFTS
ncbi:hypothetical protein CEXT_126881 [Caerostris extrusa]|uniref:Uncharacterized protein n=1 Tax=Caerostris extrusa TaxID=172846 RepID=A0AAV4XUF7_CAEEX|nr:hypothetical protein CEXT_126881 [Caerostris extrusa]